MLVEDELEAFDRPEKDHPGSVWDVMTRAAAELRRLRKPRKFRVMLPVPGESNIIQVVDAEEILE
jgi:hypothetical protein